MLIFCRLTVLVIVAITLASSLYAQADTLRFAWPDGAAAKVHVRSEGRQVISESKTNTWNMYCDFTMHLKRINDRIVVSRNDYSGWKGTLAPPLGAGAEQFVDMVPTTIVTEGGTFVGIEGYDTARKLMAQVLEQSGGLTRMDRNWFETISSNASLEAMARDHWSAFVIWRVVELEPGASYKFRSVAKVPQLGGGEIDINGTVKFVKEAPCESARNDQRCIHLHSESGGDKAQVRKIIQSHLQQADPNPTTVSDWDQHVNVDVVFEKKTMLPQYLKITRFHRLTVSDKTSRQSQTSGGEYSTTYTFIWRSELESGGSHAGDTMKGSAPDFSHVTSKEAVMKLASEGKLVKILLFPSELGGADIPENVVYVPPGVPEIKDQVTNKVIGLVEEGLNINLRVMPEYKGNSFVPSKIHIKASHAEKRGNFERTIEIW